MGTDEIRAIVLNPTGTRQEVRAELRDKSVELRGEGGKLVTISRNDVFPWHEPVRVEWLPPHVPQTVEGEEPPPAFSVALQPPVFSEGRRFIVVGHNDFTPIRYEADLDNEAARREASVIKQISRMATAQKEAQRRVQNETFTRIAFVAAIIAAVFAIVMAIVMLAPRLGGDEGKAKGAGLLYAIGVVAALPRLRRMRDLLARRPSRDTVERALRGYEECLIIHDLWTPGYSLVLAPRRELVRQDIRARYTKRKPWGRFLLPAICATMGFVPCYAVGMVMVLFGSLSSPWGPAIVGGVVGLGAGWWWMRSVSLRPLWVFRLHRREEGEELEPVFPRPLLQDYGEAPLTNDKGEAMTNAQGERLMALKPMVIRSGFMKRVSEQPHVRRLFMGDSEKGALVKVGAILLFAFAMGLMAWIVSVAAKGQ